MKTFFYSLKPVLRFKIKVKHKFLSLLKNVEIVFLMLTKMSLKHTARLLMFIIIFTYQ